MRRIAIFFICFSILVINLFAGGWQKDVLGDGYLSRYVTMADDYSGKVRATVIKKQSKCNSKKAILYVHGYNDYFFQKEIGDRFVDSCYNFYAVDLRKYGRSLTQGQNKFEVRDMKEYFADIDSALNIIVKDGNQSILLMGHSTGGLTTSYYLASNRGNQYPISGLILNSPFLDMNLGSFTENVLIPVVSWLTIFSDNINISQGDSRSYAESLLKKYHGEWDYNTNWKMEISPDVNSGWINAIHQAQKIIQAGTDIKVPILLMHSSQSYSSDVWNPMCSNADIVLDVNDISKYGRKLGKNIVEFKVNGGLHDLFLSKKSVREPLYQHVFKWIKDKNI